MNLYFTLRDIFPGCLLSNFPKLALNVDGRSFTKYYIVKNSLLTGEKADIYSTFTLET